MPTLADLTLQLSHGITRNEHERAAAVAALDREQAAALAALPGAGPPIQRRAAALVQARAEHDESQLDIEADLREAVRLAGVRRRAGEDDADRRSRLDDAAAEARCRAVEEKAMAAFEAASLDIERRKLTPGEKVLARADARRILDRAMAAAREALAAARLDHQDRLIDDRRAAAGQEELDGQDARAKADARRQIADRTRDLAIAAGDDALQAALAGLPGAAAVMADVAERRREVERRFDAREAALYAAFRQARAAGDANAGDEEPGRVAG
jgi:hypothetical protein